MKAKRGTSQGERRWKDKWKPTRMTDQAEAETWGRGGGVGQNRPYVLCTIRRIEQRCVYVCARHVGASITY